MRGAEDQARHADERDLARARHERVVARVVGAVDGLEEREAEVEIVDHDADCTVRRRVVARVEHAVAVAVRVADADEGMHVLGADGQDVDHLGRAWGAGQVHRHRIREAREREAAADVDEVVDDERHVAEGAHYAARRIEHHVRRHAALLGPGRDGERRDAEVDRAPAARAVYFDAEMIGAQRDAGDADDRDAAARLERVVARMVGGAGRLEQRQAELDVMQREAHRAVGMHAAVGVEIRPAHADEGIDAARADLEDVHILGRDVVGEGHLLVARLAEGELAAQEHEVGDAQAHRAAHFERLAREVDHDEVANARPGRHLEAGGAAVDGGVGERARAEIDRRSRRSGVLALVDGDIEPAAELDVVDADELDGAAALEREVALGRGRHGLREYDRQVVDGD